MNFDRANWVEYRLGRKLTPLHKKAIEVICEFFSFGSQSMPSIFTEADWEEPDSVLFRIPIEAFADCKYLPRFESLVERANGMGIVATVSTPEFSKMYYRFQFCATMMDLQKIFDKRVEAYRSRTQA